MPPGHLQFPSRTHLLLIPSYNTGDKVLEVVREAIAHWSPVWVVVDGSTDGSDKKLLALRQEDHQKSLRVLVLEKNRGKGGAILHALDLAAKKGFTHVLCMDADGQHPAAKIRDFMALSFAHPEAMILGAPIFDSNAPLARVHGRKLSNMFMHLETLFCGIDDSLFGFRLYPIAELRQVMHGIRWARRYDFDPEVAVRLVWEGVRPINFRCPVRYLTATQGGVSHFKYFRDNCLLTWMHLRLILTFLLRLPSAWRWRRWQKRTPVPPAPPARRSSK